MLIALFLCIFLISITATCEAGSEYGAGGVRRGLKLGGLRGARTCRRPAGLMKKGVQMPGEPVRGCARLCAAVRQNEGNRASYLITHENRMYGAPRAHQVRARAGAAAPHVLRKSFINIEFCGRKTAGRRLFLRRISKRLVFIRPSLASETMHR